MSNPKGINQYTKGHSAKARSDFMSRRNAVERKYGMALLMHSNAAARGATTHTQNALAARRTASAYKKVSALKNKYNRGTYFEIRRPRGKR